MSNIHQGQHVRFQYTLGKRGNESTVNIFNDKFNFSLFLHQTRWFQPRLEPSPRVRFFYMLLQEFFRSFPRVSDKNTRLTYSDNWPVLYDKHFLKTTLFPRVRDASNPYVETTQSKNVFTQSKWACFQSSSDNVVYVDFANKDFGGGVLGRGFVQEEKLVSMTSALSLAILKRCIENNTWRSNFAPTLRKILATRLSHLHKNPILFTTYNTAVEIGNHKPSTYYGRQMPPVNWNANNQNPSQITRAVNVWTVAPQPKLITIVAGAVPNIKGSHLSNTAMMDFYDIAYRCFALCCIVGKKMIISGPWGTGAFGWPDYVSYRLQMMAFQSACRDTRTHNAKLIFSGTPRIPGLEKYMGNEC